MPVHKPFKDHLLHTRKKRGLTVAMVAKACGVSRSYITLIENGRRMPGKKILPKIAFVLRVKTVVVLNWYLEDIRHNIYKELNIS